MIERIKMLTKLFNSKYYFLFGNAKVDNFKPKNKIKFIISYAIKSKLRYNEYD